MSDIKVTELDFDILKENLKDFLRGQEEFQDYDFDGSGLQILLDILSANTHYNAIYQNMIANEMFLDSAILRESVVSRAKALGYTPNSIKSAQTTITLKLIESSGDEQPSSVALPAFSNFSSTKDGVTYIFQNTEGVTLNDSGDRDTSNRKIYSSTFDIRQGVMVEQNFIVKTQENPNQRFIIDNDNADITTLIVRVKENSEATPVVFNLSENVVEISSIDNVYWISENESGKYELFFGNGRIGRKLENNNEISIQYLTTSGSVGNNIKNNFNFSDILFVTNTDNTISEYSLYSITSNGSSFGGSDKEDIEEIRFNSPKEYERQNRSVTALDYKYLVQNKYQNIDSIKVWGGEDNDPVYYGRVFISIKPKTGSFLTESAKESIIRDIIKEYNIVTIDAEIVDPTYTYIDVNVNVKYNLREVPQGEEYLKSLILNSISNYNQTSITKFDSYFRFSKFTSSIDSTSDSIKSNITKIKIKNRLEISLGLPTSYKTKFNSEVVEGKLESSSFTYSGYSNCFLEDEGGNLKVSTYYDNQKITVQNNVGSIVYTTGEINLVNFAPTFIDDGNSYIELKVEPLDFDISPLRNQIITIDESSINISMENISKQFLSQNNI